jgi:hypothetical protein
MDVPKLPPKKLLFNSDPTFLQTRKSELEVYLRTLLQTSCFSQSEEMWEFLTDSKV